MRLIYALLYIIIIGIAAHFIGEALPRTLFNPSRFPFAPLRFERGNKLYRGLRVWKWKDKLPDMSRIATDMTRKSISLNATSAQAWDVVIETCVAEIVHWVLMLLAYGIYLIYRCSLGAWIAIIYALSHLPFIIIQRYNRPTLVTLSKRLKSREENRQNAHTDTLRQHG